jgi:hypothetical protein
MLESKYKKKKRDNRICVIVSFSSSESPANDGTTFPITSGRSDQLSYFI